MANGDDPRGEAMAYWGVISRGASEGRPASEVMQLVREEASRIGHAPSFQTMTEAARLYGQASGLQHSSNRLGQAAPNAPITTDYLGRLPYGSQLTSPAGPRLFDVRVGFRAIRSGQETEDYVTLRYSGGLPATVGQLRAEADLIAANLVEGYGATYLEMTDIQIGEL